MKSRPDADWDEVLSAAARLQGLVREAVLVGGTASAVFAGHRTSYDADHVVPELRENFGKVLSDLESVAGWQTARVKEPVLILGSLDGIETGVRQLIRSEPLETTEVYAKGQKIIVPTPSEILRIKGALILKRNATRDYLDFAALSRHLGSNTTCDALKRFDELYPQPNGASPLQQLYIQLASPRPYDFSKISLPSYKNLSDEWKDWKNVVEQCQQVAVTILDQYPQELKVQQEHSILIDTASSYTEQLKTFLDEKKAQTLRLESKIDDLIIKQQQALLITQQQKPSSLSSLWKGKAWAKVIQSQTARLATLTARRSHVQGIRTSMDGKRLVELARKKLQRAEPELVARYDAQQRIGRELRADEALRQAQDQQLRQSRGQGLTLRRKR